MAHYAYIDESNTVTQVIVGKDEWEDDNDWEEYYGAVRTSYNTHGGQHPSGKPFRYNYASKNFTFDPNFGPDGAFIPPRPYPSWNLNLETALWDAPLPMPKEKNCYWDEDSLSWIEITE
jgi:hypothetical protein